MCGYEIAVTSKGKVEKRMRQLLMRPASRITLSTVHRLQPCSLLRRLHSVLLYPECSHIPYIHPTTEPPQSRALSFVDPLPH